MAATAMGKIFTCGPTFRAEHSDTPRHLAEFWMVEPEMAWYDLGDTIKVARDLITYCLKYAADKCVDELALLRSEPLDTSPEFVQITYAKALAVLKEQELLLKDCEVPKWGDDLGTPHERFLSDKYYKAPVIITNYPKEMKSFYMHQDDDGRTVGCFDLLLPGIGEAIGGSQREVRLDVLEKELLLRNMNKEDYKEYLELRKFGSVPHSGFGLGFERLVRYVADVDHIRDVIPFPVYYGHL
jgi:asparaginyl-tRNA synthetase